MTGSNWETNTWPTRRMRIEHLRAELRQRGVLVAVTVLGATLPQAAEAAPELLLQGLGKMVLGQAATMSAAGTGGVAAKISSAVAAVQEEESARTARNDPGLGRRVHWLAGSRITFGLNFLKNQVEGLLWTRDGCGSIAVWRTGEGIV